MGGSSGRSHMSDMDAAMAVFDGGLTTCNGKVVVCVVCRSFVFQRFS